jgi:glutaminase
MLTPYRQAMSDKNRISHLPPLAVTGLLLAALLAGCSTGPKTSGVPSPGGSLTTATQAIAGPAGVDSSVDIAALQRDVDEVMASLQSNHDGKLYAGAVDGVNPDDLALAVALIDGRTIASGDSDVQFPLMSVSKPFTYALALEQRGVDYMLERIGVSATGLPYNSVTAGAVRRTSEQNPMVNAGAIATHSHVLGADSAAKSRAVVELYSRLANAALAIREAWRATPRALTYTLAYQMQAAKRLEGDVKDVANRYLESNIVAVTASQLAQMGATLANRGTQPLSKELILSPDTVRTVLAAMVIAGMYEDSGNWWTRVGVPAKSGVSGGIVAVVPGWGAIVAYSPRLDAAGNSVRAALAIEQLVRRWQLHSIDRLLDQRR